MNNAKNAIKEIYFLYHEATGSITGISSELGRNDASKLSRQINPNDEQRDNFYQELLEVHEAMMERFPDLEEKIWHVLECRRAAFRARRPTRRMQTLDRITNVHAELGDVLKKHSCNAPREEVITEAFELVKASQELLEDVAAGEMTREEIKAAYIS